MIASGKQFQLPMPLAQERPTEYADRVGRLFAGLTAPERKRDSGQFFTPITVADFMARLGRLEGSKLRLLDPGAGTGILGCALCEALAARAERPQAIDLIAYEADARLAAYLSQTLAFLESWLMRQGVTLSYEVRNEDFVLANAEAVANEPTLFPPLPHHPRSYDAVIANPPYFKLPKSDPRAQAASAIVHGQPNIYALFMAVSAALLKDGGELVCITPRSYAAGSYFQLFRERFFARMQPLALHLFGSRREAFERDEVLQENVILRARRVDGWRATAANAQVEISWSNGLQDLAQPRRRLLPLTAVLDPAGKESVLRIPLAAAEDEIVRLVRAWPGSLRLYGMEISTGPVVPFRATTLISQTGTVPQTHAPLLWMQNVIPMSITWPVAARNKAQYIVADERAQPLLVRNRNYVLLRRFSAKEAQRRLIAAPLLAGALNAPLIGLENHLNYVYRPGGSLTEEETYGLAALFNSALLDIYFRTFNGNTQVSATELRALPLPPLDLIKELGRRVMNAGPSTGAPGALVEQLLGVKPGETNGKDRRGAGDS